MRQGRLGWFVVLCVVLAGLPGFAGEDEDAQLQARLDIEAFHASLLEAAQIGDQADREALLQQQIPRLFDNQRIAAISLGRTWRSLSAAQRDKFVLLLSDLIVATYADRFDNFSGQRFVTETVQAVKSGVVVQTRLVRASGESVTLDYLLRSGKVFNVVADGVSDLSLRRADYNSIVKNEGYPQLIAHMENKLALARRGQ